jgi:Flp pilus assembly pilin Flp
MSRRNFWAQLGAAERGATMLEYALVATFIAVVVSAALVAFGPAVSALFIGATNAL